MVFVTGGTGMVGAHLLYELVSKGVKVRALKRPGSSTLRTEKIFSYYSSDYKSLMQNIEWADGDILEKDSLGELLTGVDQIYHIAAMISFDPKDSKAMIHNNVEGTINLVDLALSLQIPRFCHVSSVAAIGSPPEGVEANEEHPWRNSLEHSAYAESKYFSEMEVWRAILQGLNAVIVNPSVIVGPSDWKSGSSLLFSTVWKGLKFYTKGGTGFVDVRDVAKAMRLLMADNIWEDAKNQRYILNAENMPFRRFFNQIADCLQVKQPKFFAGNFQLNLAFRLSKIKSFLTGSSPLITRDTVRSANRISYYDGSKICRAIGFEYTPVEVSISNNSQLFLNDFNTK
jgi:dihydroflavonol-4-reductase